MKNLSFLLGLSVLAICLSACATDPDALMRMRVQCEKKHDPWHSSSNDYFSCIQGSKYRETENKQDAPLHNMEHGTQAFAKGNLKSAKKMFEQAAHAVETIYGGSAQAQKARSAFRQEANKLFIGETHERAMVFHYLGLIDLARGNYQNARASFRSSLLQDSLSADKKARQDFASSLWLRGWAAHCLGNNKAKKDFAKANKIIRTKSPARGDNLLVVFEMGEGPYKITIGRNGEQLAYAEHLKSPIEREWPSSSRNRFNLFRANDLFFQAVTRGDRTFDEYLKAKSKNKETAKKVANAALGTASVALDMASKLGSNNVLAYGLYAVAGTAGIIGGVSHAVGSGIDAVADSRTWRTLPHQIYMGSFKVPVQAARNLKSLKGHNPSLTRFIKWVEDGDEYEEQAYFVAGKGKCRLLWVRDQSSQHDN